MAVFNPQIQPTQDPNYFRYSEPISDIKAIDKSSAMMTEAIGSGIEGTAKLADDTAKQFIGEEVHKKVDALRTDFTNDLQTVLDTQRGVTPQKTGGPLKVMAFDDDGTGTTEQSVPSGIDSGLQKVDGLQSALTNGKINDTYYTQRLSAVAVDLRTRYPGYRDYIDQRIAQATGSDPANATVQNLMQDLNRHASNKKGEEDKILDMARAAMHTGLQGSKEQYARLQMDPMGYKDKFLDWYTSATENKYAIEGDNARRANRKGNREEIAADDESKFTDLVGKTIQTNFHSAVTIPGTDTPQGILEFVGKVAAQPDQYKGAQLETLATQIMAQRNTLAAQLHSASNQSRDGIPSYTSTIGAAKRDEIIKSQLSVYDQVYDALKNKDAGLAYYHMNHARAVLDDKKDNLLTGPMGQDLATFKTFNDLAGPTWTSLVVDSGLRVNIDKKMRGVFEQNSMEARAQPDFDKTGKPVTLEQHMQQATQWEKDGKITAQMKGRYINNLVNIVDDIKDPKAPEQAKINVVRYLFSPEGRGILAGIKTDYVDPDTGKPVPGKYAVFSRLTSEDVVQSVSKLAKSHPEIGQMYKNYLENEAGSQLFYKELQNLNRFTGHDDLHFKYDSGTNGIPRIELIDKDGKPVQSIERTSVPGQWNRNKPAEDAEYLTQINKVVNRINGGLASLGRVENGLGGDANEYMLNFLQRAQVDLGKNWEGLPQKLIDAIAASRAPARRIEDTFQDAKGRNK